MARGRTDTPLTAGQIIGANVRRLRMERGFSANALAQAVGVRVHTIQQIEAGKTQRSRYLPDIARVLRVTMAMILAGVPQMPPPAPVGRLPAPDELPVFASTEAGDGAMVCGDSAVDHMDRPRGLTAQGVYGVIVTGESMLPAVRPGDTVVVNPHRVPRREDLCVFRSEQHGEFRSTIKEFVGGTVDTWRVKRYRPEEKEFTLRRRDWPQCHVVVSIHRP